MTREQINSLIDSGGFPDHASSPELVETHISWVLIGEQFVYKIKKPMQYSFLDFSTLEKRKFYCQREVELNRRLTEDIYLGVLEVREWNGRLSLDAPSGEILDYAVLMRKIDRSLQMDKLLQKNKVTETDIRKLAEKIARFHRDAAIISSLDPLRIREEFDDLGGQKEFLSREGKGQADRLIRRAMEESHRFMEKHQARLFSRLGQGLFRDVHGDLHSRNIFLLAEPQPFDCIEFNDEFRQIDTLNEVAFLCMDLEALGFANLSESFMRTYSSLFPALTENEDQELFTYYKAYRSNVRAKVNSLRARTATQEEDKRLALAESEKYLLQMDGYIRSLQKA